MKEHTYIYILILTLFTLKTDTPMAFRISQQHWELFVNFMEKPWHGKGRIEGPCGNEQMRKLWDQLSQELNALGMGSITTIKWKKVKNIHFYCNSSW